MSRTVRISFRFATPDEFELDVPDEISDADVDEWAEVAAIELIDSEEVSLDFKVRRS